MIIYPSMPHDIFCPFMMTPLGVGVGVGGGVIIDAYPTVCWEDLGIVWFHSLVTNLSNVLTPGQSAGNPGLDPGLLIDYTLDFPYTTFATSAILEATTPLLRKPVLRSGHF